MKEEDKGRLQKHCFQETGWGFIANTRIRKGEVILDIPKDIMVTTATVLQSPVGKAVEVCVEDGVDALAIYLLFIRSLKEDSDRYCYVQKLPTSFSTPIYWDQQTLNELQDHQQIDKIKKQRKELGGNYERLLGLFKEKGFCPGIISLDWFSEMDYLWAWNCVMTRSVFANTKSKIIKRFNKDTTHVALIPFADFLNHSNQVETKGVYNVTTNSFQITTLNDIEKDNEIFIHYGSHNNDVFLEVYGFVIDANVNDVAYLKVNLEGVSEEKIEFLAGFNLISDKYEVNMDGIGWNLLSVLRIAFSSEDELPLWNNILDDNIISIKNEKLVWEYIEKECSTLLNGMATTLEEDEALLKQQIYFSNYKTAILWRKNKKRILQALKQTALQQINKFTTSHFPLLYQ
uniref:SET domain-containing protein n=1 Tax=Arcella intermedia TaxID=1963864 RepID=A0A6B2L5W5_9EUKA